MADVRVWKARALMGLLPVTATLVFLGGLLVRCNDVPLTRERGYDAIAAYCREHPDAFDGYFADEGTRMSLKLPPLHSAVQDYELRFDLEPHTYSYANRALNRRLIWMGLEPREECGRFERRWGTWVALPPEVVIDEPAGQP